MGERLKERLKQKTFGTPYMEALLNLMVCADYVERITEETCGRHGVTSAQYNVLRILRGVYPDGHPRCQIIERMIHAAPDVTRLIDRLIKGGYARRDKSTTDGRLSLTFITEKGLALLDTMKEDIDRNEQILSTRMSEKEARMLSKLCEQVYAVDDTFDRVR